jgi:hypothetical protein
MNFEVGDEVIYNPSVSPLPPINKRPWDLGKIRKIKNGYIYFESYYWGPNDIHKICPDSMSYSPSSPKYIRSVYKKTLISINEAFLQRKTRLQKNKYPLLKEELIMSVFRNPREDI